MRRRYVRRFLAKLNRLPFDIYVWYVLARTRILIWRLRMGEKIKP